VNTALLSRTNANTRADQIRRTLSLASLDKLLLVSTDSSHRERVIAGVQKAGRELVWRDSDEEKLFPRDYERALVLAAKRGLRASIPTVCAETRLAHPCLERAIGRKCRFTRLPLNKKNPPRIDGTPACHPRPRVVSLRSHDRWARPCVLADYRHIYIS